MTRAAAPQGLDVTLKPARFKAGPLTFAAIRASYSADMMAIGHPVRSPFIWEGEPWLCTSIHGDQCEAYQVVARADWPHGDPAKIRHEPGTPLGAYHGNRIRFEDQELFLLGPYAYFRLEERITEEEVKPAPPALTQEPAETLADPEPEPPASAPPALTVILVDPARFGRGGDIHGSYSSDRISEYRYGKKQPIAPPFKHQGRFYVNCGGVHWDGNSEARCYEIVDLSAFPGDLDAIEPHRDHPLGGYHGQRVLYRGEERVLVGPPLIFRTDTTKAMPRVQASLF